MMHNRSYDALEFSDRISSHSSAAAAGRELSRLAECFGYKAFVLASFDSIGAPTNPKILATTWHQEWQTRYLAEDYILDDPVVAKATRATRPFFWRDVWTEGFVTERGKQILGEAESFSMPDGIFVPIFGPRGLSGTLAFGGEKSELSETDIKALHLAGIYAFEHFSNLSADADEPEVELTRRELECLKWTSAGKTSLEIADTLGISRHTADWYLKEATQKLGALNRTHAVMLAYRKGLIA